MKNYCVKYYPNIHFLYKSNSVSLVTPISLVDHFRIIIITIIDSVKTFRIIHTLLQFKSFDNFEENFKVNLHEIVGNDDNV